MGATRLLTGKSREARIRLQEGWVIANHILVSFHVAFISSVLALPPEVSTRGEVLWFVFCSPETLVSALFLYASFHAGIALHELGHLTTAARLRALNDDALARVEPQLQGPLWGRLRFYARTFLLAPFGAAPGIERQGLNYYPDAPYNLAVAAAGPRASRNVALIALPPALLLLGLGLAATVPAAIYVGRFALGIGVVTLLDFLMADPGKYREFKLRERRAARSAERVEKLAGWLERAPEVKRQMGAERMQEAMHPRLGLVTAPWQFRNCGMGGRHTEKEYPESNISMQEAMFVILGARDYQESQEMTVRLQNRLKEIIEKEDGCRVMGIGLEGGLAPYVDRGTYPLPELRLWAMMKQAIEECGHRPGHDVAIALDPALSELEIAYREEFDVPGAVGMYLFWRDQTKTVHDRNGVLEIYEQALTEYEIPIISIEDGFSEHDFEGWEMLLERLGDRIFVIGDDLVTTNDRTIEDASSRGLINSVLVKANQIGTLYETLLAVLTTLGKGLEVVVSHRSKSPNDDMEAHIALSTNALGLKAGGGSNTERLVKYHAVTVQMEGVAAAGPRDESPAVRRAIVSRVSAHEEPTNAGIPTVGAEVELSLPETGVAMSFRGATPLGTSAGTGEAVHLVDRFVEYAENPEVIDRHPECFEEAESGVYQFRGGVTRSQLDAGGEDLRALFAQAQRYGGKGCRNAVDNVQQILAPYFVERNVGGFGLLEIDRALLQLELEVAQRRGKCAKPPEEGEAIAVMQRKQNVGMNALLSTSLALARGVAHVQGKELHELLREEMLALIARLTAAHGVTVAGGGFDDYVAALREVNQQLEARDERLCDELRRISGVYAQGPAEDLPAPQEETPPPASAASEEVELPHEGAQELDGDRREIAALSRLVARAVEADGDPVRMRDALQRYLELQAAIGARPAWLRIANQRVFRGDGRVLVPYLLDDELLLHSVRGDEVIETLGKRHPQGTIFTDELLLAAIEEDLEPVDLEAGDFQPLPSQALSIDRIRDMGAVLAQVNASKDSREVLYSLRFVVAKLCSLSFRGFLGAKNIQPEVRKLREELCHLLNGPFAPRLRLPLRILVRNVSGLVLRPKVIDELWNDTIALAEVHVRGSAITNELRRSAHHALGKATLELARAYLHYLDTGDGSELPYPGAEALSPADEEARTKGPPRKIVARVMADLEELLGTSQVVTRIREWQAAYTQGLLGCESGNRIDEELDLLVEHGIRGGNRWVYQRHLRILQDKARSGVWAEGVGAELASRLEALEAQVPDAAEFDASQVEAEAREAVGDFTRQIVEGEQQDLFDSIEGVLATYGQDSFAESFFQISRFRAVIEAWLRRRAFTEQRHLLLRLDCLMEEMGYLALRTVASQYEEEGVPLRRCLAIIGQNIHNLGYDGLYSRELVDLARMLVDESKTHLELLDVLEGIQHTYHRVFQRFSVAYQTMSEHLGLTEAELRAVLANYQRYLHDLNSMVHFVDLARRHIRTRVDDLTLRVDGEPAAPTAPEGAYDFLHLSDTERIDHLVEHVAGPSLQDLYGGKGSSLVYMSHLRIPTRDGFVIPTTLPRSGMHQADEPRLKRELARHLSVLEEDIQRQGGEALLFGDPEHPLLLAVRGGSVFSMPGMLATVVYVGMNDDVAAALAREDPWFAYDSYRRFLASYAEAVWGVDLEEFALVETAKRRCGVKFKEELPGQAMREVAEASKAAIRNLGHGEELESVLADPLRQLTRSVKAVLASWNSKRALQYREVKGLSQDWQTAVTVQRMAAGNRSNDETGPGLDETRASLTGVIPFSRMNEQGFRAFTGDVKFSACGDDLVGGLISADSFQSIGELRELMPMLSRQLGSIHTRLRRFRGTDPEIEFTVERGELSVLQARMAQTAIDEDVRGFVDPGPEATHGIGIRGGGFRGLVAFDEEDLEELAGRKGQDTDGVLLVLENPTPNEIPMILAADGLMTSRGGSTSHAAVAVHGIDDKPYSAVLGVVGIQVDAIRREVVLQGEEGEILERVGKGEVISIHGGSGAVYVGKRELHGEVAESQPVG